jgi:hypothetical protein
MNRIVPLEDLNFKTLIPKELNLSMSHGGGYSRKPTAAKCPLSIMRLDRSIAYSSTAPNFLGFILIKLSTEYFFNLIVPFSGTIFQVDIIQLWETHI